MEEVTYYDIQRDLNLVTNKYCRSKARFSLIILPQTGLISFKTSFDQIYPGDTFLRSSVDPYIEYSRVMLDCLIFMKEYIYTYIYLYIYIYIYIYMKIYI